MTLNDKLPPWDETAITTLLALDRLPDGRWHNRCADANPNGRAFGGQVLGQSLIAASHDVPPGRHPCAMQLIFLQGVMPDEPVLFEVQTLQEGKRFSSRSVRGTQGAGRTVFQAHLTFAVPMEGADHQLGSPEALQDPESFPRLRDAQSPTLAQLQRLGCYPLIEKPCMEMRVDDLAAQTRLGNQDMRFRFWLRTRENIPADPVMRAAVFAYLSDWFQNFSSFSAHMLDPDATRRVYISSLNHNIWFHRPVSPGDWMHVDSRSPSAFNGIGLSTVHVHDRQGALVATTTQQSLLAFM